MNRPFYFLILFVSFLNCSKDSTNTETTNDIVDDENNQEEEVTNLAPNNFDIDVSHITFDRATLSWNEATDPENDDVSYDVYINQELIAENILELTLEINNLSELTTYDGEVIAKDSFNNETSSSFSFSTKEYFLKYLKMYDFGPLNFNSGFASGRPFSLIKTSDNNYVIAGSKEEQFGNGNDFFIMKIDAEGNEIWKKTLSYPAGDAWNFKIIESPNGLILAGNNYLFNLNQNGNIIWHKQVEGFFIDGITSEIKSLTQDSQGNIYIIGARQCPDPDKVVEAVLAKFNTNGGLIWEKVYKPAFRNNFDDIKIDSNGHLIILGSAETSGITMEEYIAGTPDEQIDFWLLKTNLDGDIIWQNTYGDGRYDFPSELIIKTNGNYAFAGYSWGAYDISSGRLFEIENNGNELWNTSNGLSSTYSCKESLDGGFIATGIVETGGAGNYGALGIYKFDSYGNEEWNRKYYGDFARLFGRSVLTEDDGGYRIAGDLSKNIYYGDEKPQLLIYKVDATGSYSWED